MNFTKKMHTQIRITGTPNGMYVVDIGFHQFAYSDEKEMLKDIGEYLQDPKMFENKLNRFEGTSL